VARGILKARKSRWYTWNMTHVFGSATHLSDQDLIAAVERLAASERQATAHLVALLAEFDARRLYLPAGCSSLFTYCTQVLHLSEHAAYGRIEAARTARRLPTIIDLLADGTLTLTAVTLLAPHLTPENHQRLLDSAGHQSKRKIEHLVATLRPQPDVRSTIRKLPILAQRQAVPAKDVDRRDDNRVAPDRVASFAVPRAGETGSDGQAEPAAQPVAPPRLARAAVIAPLAPERYKVQFTVSRETHDKLRRAQDLLRHVVPDGDPAAIFDRALTVLLNDLEKRKQAGVAQPKPRRPVKVRSRHIPAAVRREVWSRDGGRCAFVGSGGRCTERGCLEFHHVVPYADGGETAAENLELRCRAHNAYEADTWFGRPQPSVVREATAWGRDG